jgi:hypothetical protein
MLLLVIGLLAGNSARYGGNPVMAVLQVCLGLWLLTIIYRDIQNVQSGG